jgi:RNA polymerase sigma-70 factor (ECF subfamily)
MSICLRYAYSKEEAVEVLNDSFLKVFKNITQYNPEYSFKGWLRKIIINTSIDYYRKNKKKYQLKEINLENIDLSDCSQLEKFNIEDLQVLLNELTENQRLVFNLYEIEGYKHQEIAQKLNITESSSRTILTRAKVILRAAYIKYYKIKYAKVI